MASSRRTFLDHSAAWLLALVAVSAFAQDGQVIPFDSPRWDLIQGRIVERLGRSGFMGMALVKDAEFQNGVIEFDLAVTGQRSYPGILFRWFSPGNTERLYVRPHQSNTAQKPEVIQYVPGFNGVDSWQLYNGDGFTGFAEIPYGQWVHYKVEVSGTQARVFIGDMSRPVMLIHNLKRGVSKGKVGVAGQLDGNAYYSDFSYRSDDTLRFDPPPPVWPGPGLIRDSQISQPFPYRSLDDEVPPSQQQLPPITWTSVLAEPGGRLDFSRYQGRLGRLPDRIIARTNLRADKDKVRRIRFGYSDAASVFLNGALIYSGDRRFMTQDPTFLGVLGMFDTLHLPLKKGDNELMLIITESMGGWGLMAQDAEATLLAPGVIRAWSAPETLDFPESVAYDSTHSVLYVSNFDGGNPSTQEGKQAISKLSVDGRIETLRWVEGLFNPTGLAVWKDTLFAVDRRGLVEIDIPTARVAARHTIAPVGFLNDVAVDSDTGVVYVSDSGRGLVFRVENGKAEKFLAGRDFTRANGLLVQRGILWVAVNGDVGYLKAVDIATRKVERVIPMGKGILDGLAQDDAGNLLVTHNEGRLFRVSKDGKVERLVDTTVPGMNLADDTYIGEKRTVVAPTFYANGVVAYRLSD
jgi:sugar lactone lactonase YvrE